MSERLCLDQQVVDRLALVQALAELRGLAAQLLVAQRREPGLECVDLRHGLVEPLDEAIVGCAEQASSQRTEHENLDILMT